MAGKNIEEDAAFVLLLFEASDCMLSVHPAFVDVPWRSRPNRYLSFLESVVMIKSTRLVSSGAHSIAHGWENDRLHTLQAHLPILFLSFVSRHTRSLHPARLVHTSAGAADLTAHGQYAQALVNIRSLKSHIQT